MNIAGYKAYRKCYVTQTFAAFHRKFKIILNEDGIYLLFVL